MGTDVWTNVQARPALGGAEFSSHPTCLHRLFESLQSSLPPLACRERGDCFLNSMPFSWELHLGYKVVR